MQALHQGRILGLRVTDDDIIRGEQKAVGDLTLGRKALAAARCSQDQTVGIFQQLAVHHDEVVGQGVDTVVQGFLAILEQLLRGERNKDGRGAGGQPPLNLNLIEAKGQAAHQPFLLLEVQTGQLAVVLLCDGAGLEDVVVQLPGIVRRVQHQEGHKEHSLVPALQVLQELLGLGTVGGKVGRDNVHVVSGTDSLFLFLDLAAVQIGDFPLDRLDGLYLVHRLDVQADDQAGFHIQKISQHTVIQLRRKNLDEADRPILLAHAELFTGAELKARRSDKVLGGQPRRSQPVPFKPERHLLIHVENTVKLCQPRLAAQRFRHDPQPLEVVENVGLDALQTRFGSLEAVSVDTEGQVLGLDKAVIALGQLVLQHGHVLGSDTVEVIPLEGNGNRTGKGFFGCRKVQKRQLKSDRTVEVVEEVTPALKDCRLVLVLRELIVDVLKLDGLGVMAVRQTANAVRPYPLIGDAVLCGLFLFVRAVGAGNGGFDLFSVGAGKFLLGNRRRLLAILIGLPVFLCGEQCHTPPCRVLPAVPARHRSCWSYTGAV